MCAATTLSDTIRSFYRSDCTADFLAFLTELTVNEYGEDRDVICIFHDLKGYGSVFLQHQLQKEGRRMEDMVKTGTEALPFCVGPIFFKGSLCFLPVALFFFYHLWYF